MPAQRLVALGQILLFVHSQVLVGRRQAVGAVLPRCAAKPPQGLLQAFGQGGVGLAPQHHLEVTPAAEREAEVVEPVRQRLAVDPHHDRFELGEVRQPQPPRLLALAEHHFLVRSVQGLPCLDPPLECALFAVRVVPRVAVLKVLEQRCGVQARLLVQQRDYLTVPHPRKGILTCTPVTLLVLQWLDLAGVDTPPRSLRYAGPRAG